MRLLTVALRVVGTEALTMRTTWQQVHGIFSLSPERLSRPLGAIKVTFFGLSLPQGEIVPYYNGRKRRKTSTATICVLRKRP